MKLLRYLTGVILNIKEVMMICRIIFVCTGNTCRSPMAEALAREETLKQGLNMTVLSRGLSVIEGEKANEKSAAAMRDIGLSLDSHRAKSLKESDISEDTLILTMTEAHKSHVLARFNKASMKVYTLKEYAGQTGNIEDPYGSSQQVYDSCAKCIEETVKTVITKLREKTSF